MKLKVMLMAAIVFIALPVLCIFAQDSAEQSLPQAFFAETRYEFEPVIDGQEVVHDFIIQNKGSAVLHVQRVKTG